MQELNPDPADALNEEDEDDHLYEDAEEEMYEAEYDVEERGGGDAGMTTKRCFSLLFHLACDTNK